MLKLRIRGGTTDWVEGAVATVDERLPDGWPRPRFAGRVLSVPLHPDCIDLLYEELRARGLEILARRLVDPVRWRSK